MAAATDPIATIPGGNAIASRIGGSLGGVIRGQDRAIRLLLGAFAAGGHVLLEDVPGTGKTTLAKALANSVSARFQRIQFTPDLLPADILGISVFNQKDQSFEFHPGPVFSNVLLADEINRASPRTQAALLEAMGEGQVSLDGERRELDDPFFVIATQNPLEFQGTYPLPEAQMDRFAMCFGLGYVSPEEEVEILSAQTETHPVDAMSACATLEEVRAMRRATRQVRMSEEITRYIVDLVGATRAAEGVRVGASPRASVAVMHSAKAMAMLDGLDFVGPDQVREVAVPVIAHRIIMEPQSRYAGLSAAGVVEDALESVPVPT